MRFILLLAISVIIEEVYIVNYGCIADGRVFSLYVLYMKSYDVGVLDRLKSIFMNANFKDLSYFVKGVRDNCYSNTVFRPDKELLMT